MLRILLDPAFLNAISLCILKAAPYKVSHLCFLRLRSPLALHFAIQLSYLAQLLTTFLERSSILESSPPFCLLHRPRPLILALLSNLQCLPSLSSLERQSL
jgi:hypothetical protein